MRRLVLGLVLAATIGTSPLLAVRTPAHAGVNYDEELISCSVWLGKGYSTGTWGSSGTMESVNSGIPCYYVSLGGHMRYADGTYNWLPSSWVGGSPSSVTWSRTGNIVEVSGLHNVCENGYVNCNGYDSTLAYQ